MLMSLPNLPDASVPVGGGESRQRRGAPLGRRRARSTSRRRTTSTSARRSAWTSTPARSSRGSRFSFLRGPVARLHRAIAQFMLDVQTAEHGYTECWTPYIVNREVLEGTGQLPKFKDDMFWVTRGGDDASPEQYLISTSEISLTNSVREQLLAADALPIRLTAHTPCFRSEAGSAGKDQRGMIRQHQFDKVEMVQIVHPEQSYERSSRWSATARRAQKARAAVPGGAALHRRHGLRIDQDLRPRGLGAGAEHLPRDQLDARNCEAFQARRMQTRFKNAQGKNELVHTLNGSGLAVGRTLVAVLENFQNADGSVADSRRCCGRTWAACGAAAMSATRAREALAAAARRARLGAARAALPATRDPAFDLDEAYARRRRAAAAAPRARRAAARLQDRLHQSRHLGPLRRARADLGPGLGAHAGAARRRRGARVAGTVLAAAARARDHVRPRPRAARRHGRTPSSPPASTGSRTATRSCTRTSTAGASRPPTRSPTSPCTAGSSSGGGCRSRALRRSGAGARARCTSSCCDDGEVIDRGDASDRPRRPARRALRLWVDAMAAQPRAVADPGRRRRHHRHDHRCRADAPRPALGDAAQRPAPARHAR